VASNTQKMLNYFLAVPWRLEKKNHLLKIVSFNSQPLVEWLMTPLNEEAALMIIEAVNSHDWNKE